MSLCFHCNTAGWLASRSDTLESNIWKISKFIVCVTSEDTQNWTFSPKQQYSDWTWGLPRLSLHATFEARGKQVTRLVWCMVCCRRTCRLFFEVYHKQGYHAAVEWPGTMAHTLGARKLLSLSLLEIISKHFVA